MIAGRSAISHRAVWYNALLLGVIACAAAGCQRDYIEDADAYRIVLGTHDVEPPLLDDDQALSLGDAVRLTNHHDERLGLEGEAYVQAIIDRQRAVARFLPTVDLAPRYVRRMGDRPGSAQRDQLDVGVLGTLNLFDGFRKDAQLHLASATIESRRASLRNLQAGVLLETVAVFFEVLRREGEVEVLRNTSALQDERVRDIRSRRDAGLARPLEVSQAEAQAASTRVLLIAAQTDVRNSRSALALLTATAMASRPLVDDYDVPLQLPTLDAWQATAQARRDDIVAADRAIDAARHDVQVAVGQYYPSITLDLEYLLTVDNLRTDNQWNAVLRANLPIFSAGRIEADVRGAWSRVRQASLDASRVRREVVRDVEQAYQTLESARHQVDELNRRVASAELALRQAEGSYDAGLATNLERLTAQDELLAARLDLLTQEFVLKVAHLALLRAAGQLQQAMGLEPPSPPTDD
jgi:outer membrane protein